MGLGMTPDEWQELRSKVDDSFWVMRVIGTRPPMFNAAVQVTRVHLQGIPLFRMTMMDSRVELTS